MPKVRSFQPFVASLMTENILQMLENGELLCDGLLPNKKNEPTIMKSFESFIEKKKRVKKGDESIETEVMPKTVIPVRFTKDFKYAIEGIFVELKTFISENYSKVAKNKNIISNLKDAEEDNIVEILSTLIDIFDDKYNLLSYKQYEILELLSTNIVHKVTHPEVAQLFTRFILTICNYIVSNIVNKKKIYKISALELKTIIYDKSNITNCEKLMILNDMIDEHILNYFEDRKQQLAKKKASKKRTDADDDADADADDDVDANVDSDAEFENKNIEDEDLDDDDDEDEDEDEDEYIEISNEKLDP